ncbi:MAG: DUF3553 domain-containing protein [Pseudomonadota bacterium]
MDVNPLLTPGTLVRHPREGDWGIGQVQSVDGARITVNFENMGKQVLDARMVDLDVIFDP